VVSPSREFLVKSVSLQIGTICILFYFVGLLISLIMAELDERLTLLDVTASYDNKTTVYLAFSDRRSFQGVLSVSTSRSQDYLFT